MSTTEPALGAFPSPYSIQTPPGCEGWEEMYPYYALFDERRRDTDENRFWFWNSMHFPVPMPAFDVICIDSPYQAVGSWQNRVFAVPPAMGIDYRVVNGYIYISGNPVTDPAKIAERAEYFQKRAGYYYENWAELYGKWRAKMEALIAELGELRGARAARVRARRGGVRRRPQHRVLRGARRLRARCCGLGDLMWQHHFEFLLLGYGAYATFAEFCKGNLPDIPDQHIAQMVAGIDVLLFKPDAELRRLAAPGASRPASTARSSRAARRTRSTPSWRRARPAAPGWPSSRRSRTRGSTWPPATACTTTTAAGSTTRASPTRR